MRKANFICMIMLMLLCLLNIVPAQVANSNGNWTSLNSGTTNDLRSVHFINSKKGWAVGLNGTILFTSNGGDSWTAQNPGTNSTQSYGDVRFIDENVGWAGGGKVVSRTINGGANWGGLEYLSSNPWRSSLFPISATVAWGTGWSVSTYKFREFYRYTVQADGSILQEFWSQVSSDYLHNCYFIDQDNGWAVGNPGRIVRISNASSNSPSFTNQTSGTSETLVGIQMLDANIGWVVGDNGTILKTTDGGNTWSPQTSGTTVFLRGVHFVNANLGWIVGNEGTVLSTTDGGDNWTAESGGISTDLFEVCFVSADLGYAVGDSGVILKYEGGGVMNQSPVLSPIADQTISAGTTKNVSLSAIDADGDHIAFSIPNNPGFLSITNVSQIGNNATGTLVIAPAINQTATFNATVRVVDGQGGNDSKSFTITVTTTTDPPPAAPQNLRAIAHIGQVTLSWDANTESDFLRYCIYGDVNPNPTTKIDSVDGISNTQKTIEYLMNETPYYFRITAVDNVLQESSFSNEVGVIPGPSFKRVEDDEIVSEEAGSLACSWGDYDNDDDLDLFVATGLPAQNNLLYQNNGDGTFTRITEGAIVNDGGNSAGSSWGDYDNDGDLDLFVANEQGENNFLYNNNGDGSFTKVIFGVLVSDGGNSVGSSWGDYNNDNYLDLFVPNSGHTKNFLYMNNGNGTFTKITSGNIVNERVDSYCGSWADYDNDGDLDIFVANRNQNSLYRNNGDGTFTKITSGEIGNDAGHSNSASWGDYDNNGYLDLFVANEFENNFLYKNNGDGTFTKITTGILITDEGSSYSSSWGDYDNDGDLDIFVVNNGDRNLLYTNNGDGSFIQVTAQVFEPSNESHGVSWCDYDIDGDIDLFVTNAKYGQDNMYENTGNSNHWINIKCVGIVSNVSAIGTKVRVKSNIGGQAIWQLNELSGQTGGRFGGQNSLNAEFGLGNATVIDSIKIEWSSGIVQVLTNVLADQFITIEEQAATNIDPVLSPIADQTVTAGNTKNITLSASDANEDQLSFSIPMNPGFLSITNVSQTGNNATATLVIAPSLTQTGTHNATVKVEDGNGGDNTKSFKITVTTTTDPLPAAPQNLRAIAHATQVTLSWNANTELDFLRYRIYGDINPNPTTQLDSVDGISNTKKTIEYLINNTTYYFRITAVDNALQESDFSNEVSVVPGPIFTQINDIEIVTKNTASKACSWGDYDNDGNLDLFISTTGNPIKNNLLYQNNGEGDFSIITTGAIVNDGGQSRGSSWGDYDNDGDLDLFVANTDNQNNFFYTNNGDGSFTKAVFGIIISDGGNSLGSSWGDYNNDGYLDLFIANGYWSTEENFLYMNNGNGTFAKVTSGTIVNDKENSNCGSWADYDNDGDLDLFVANFGINNSLYRNNGDGTFTKITSGDIVNDEGSSHGASWGDYNNDGYLDLFVTNEFETNFLYKNNGNGTFLKITTGAIISDEGDSFGSSWGDYDNDGDLDLVVSNQGQPIFLYDNNGDGSFRKISTGEIVNNYAQRGITWCDYDNDGDLDLFAVNPGNVWDLLFKNNGNSNHWINIKCIGVVSNSSAIGTKIRVKSNIGGQAAWQLNELSGQTGGGRGSQNSLNAEFGLGDATIIDSIKVEWPSGIVQVLTNIAADQFLTITEAATPQITVTSPNGGENWPVGTPQQIKWSSVGVSGNVKIEISTDAGSTWSVIGGNVTNSGSYSWTPTASHVSNNCKIKITSVADNTVFDQSDSVFSISGAAQVDLSIDDNLTGPSGGTITIPINCSDLSGMEVYSVNFTVSYDSLVLKVTDLDISGTVAAASGWSKPPFNVSNGQISSAMAGTTPLTGSGVLINIVCDIVGSSGDSSILHFNKAILNEGNPTVSTDDGLFRVASDFDIKGKLAYFYNQTAMINDAIVLLSGVASHSDTSDANGDYEFSDLVSGNYIVTTQKDDDTKDAITAYDASLILRYNVGTMTLTPYQMIAADVSGNGDVLAFDASYILRYSIGLVTQFPVGADWTFVPHDFPIDATNWFTSPRSRSYAPLQSDQSDQNFRGILYGDVSGNWAGSIATDSLPMLELAIGSIQQNNDGKWLVSMDLKFPQVAYSGSFRMLVHNPDLNFESCLLDNSATPDVLLAANPKAGEIKIAFASSQSLNVQGIKMNLLFNPQNPVNPSASDFEFADIMVDEQSAEITAVAINDQKELPIEWALTQNYPNPFNPETVISYHVPQSSHVVIEVFNLLGQRLQKLVDEKKAVGIYQVTWDGRDESGNSVGSGIYIYKMQADGFVAIKKMALVR